MKTELSTYDNSWYNPGSKIKRLLWFFSNALFLINPVNPSSAIKIKILQWFGAKIGHGVTIKPGVNIKYPWLLTVGNNVWIGEKVWIDNLAMVTIADNACVSQEAMLLCGNHNYTKPSFDLIIAPITLETGAWVAAKAIVCPGVTINSHAVLTVGSIATKNLDPYTIYQGNPAIKMKSRHIV